MDQRQITTNLALRELGIQVDVSTFDQRLTVQKAIYLAQSAGVDLGYYFRWYLRGPYAPELADDAYGIDSELKSDRDESSSWRLSENLRSKLAPLRELIPAQDRPHSLEILASVHFLITRGQTKTDIAELKKILQSYGKDFSNNEIRDAIDHLRKYGLIVECI